MSVSLLFRTPHGRWQWWPILQLVEFVPKGKQRADKTKTVILSPGANNHNKAMIAALKGELKVHLDYARARAEMLDQNRKTLQPKATPLPREVKDAIQAKEALPGRNMDARE